MSMTDYNSMINILSLTPSDRCEFQRDAASHRSDRSQGADRGTEREPQHRRFGRRRVRRRHQLRARKFSWVQRQQHTSVHPRITRSLVPQVTGSQMPAARRNCPARHSCNLGKYFGPENYYYAKASECCTKGKECLDWRPNTIVSLTFVKFSSPRSVPINVHFFDLFEKDELSNRLFPAWNETY